MPRKKKAETEPSTPKTSPKPKTAAKVKTAPKAARATARKTETAKPPQKEAAVPRGRKAAPAPVPPAAADPAWKKPHRQGETQMVAFIRDPHCIFTYWEVTPESIASVKRHLMEEYKDSTMVLRVFRTGVDGQSELIQEIRVEPGEMNRYVELQEGVQGGYFVEIAQKTASGRTVVYARSNKVLTGAALAFPGPGGGPAQWEAPAGLLEYFAETEGAVDPEALRGLSSAEAHRRALLLKQKHMGRYSASKSG